MKKYRTNYLDWLIWFVIYLFMIIAVFYEFLQGLTYEKKYSMDFTGHILVLTTAALLGLILWETLNPYRLFHAHKIGFFLMKTSSRYHPDLASIE